MGLMDLKKAELVALAKEHDVDTTGTKADLVERLEPLMDWDESDSDSEEAVDDAPKGGSFDISAFVASQADVEDEKDFVKAAYVAILRRDADPAGLSHYSACIWFHKTMSREDVCSALLASGEYKSLMESL